MEITIKHRVRSTPPTLVCVVEVHDEVDSPRNILQINRQLDVYTPLTPTPDYLLIPQSGVSSN